jgi:hypothetical protein
MDSKQKKKFTLHPVNGKFNSTLRNLKIYLEIFLSAENTE